MTITLIIIAAVAVIIMLWLITTYNKFIAKNNRVKQTESSICVMLKQRNDMIPNLVAAVQTYMGHENATLVKIAELRAQMQQSGNEQQQVQLGTEMSKALANVKVAVENYPDLKADQHFLRLFDGIEEMEYQLQAVRRTFNAAAVDFNNYVQMFPSNIIASMKNYQLYQLITIPESEMANVDVKALFKN
jgi:LemA protein